MTCIVICLVLRLFQALMFNETIGPLINILQKMTNDYIAYTIIQVLFWILFTTAFFMNY